MDKKNTLHRNINKRALKKNGIVEVSIVGDESGLRQRLQRRHPREYSRRKYCKFWRWPPPSWWRSRGSWTPWSSSQASNWTSNWQFERGKTFDRRVIIFILHRYWTYFVRITVFCFYNSLSQSVGLSPTLSNLGSNSARKPFTVNSIKTNCFSRIF